MTHFSKEEIQMIYNALNELCNGVDIPEFELRLGYSESEFYALLKKIGKFLESTEH